MATTEHASERTYLSDYRPPDYYIPRVDLVFDLDGKLVSPVELTEYILRPAQNPVAQ